MQYLIILCFFIPGLILSAQEDPDLIFTLKGHDNFVNYVSFNHDATRIISGSEDQTIKIWDIGTGEELNSKEAHFRGIRHVNYIYEGNNILSAGDRSIKIWNKDLTSPQILTGHHTDIWSVGVSFDENYLVSGCFSKSFLLWDLRTGENIREFEAHEKSVLAVDFASTDYTMASGSLDETIRIWDMNSGKQKYILRGHAGNIYDLEFTSDDKYLISCSLDKTIKIWNVDSGSHVKTLVGHEEGVMSICIGPEDRYLLSASVDQTVKLWELASGNVMYTYFGHEDIVNCVNFSPDGKYFVSCSNDECIIYWKISSRVFTQYFYPNEFDEELKSSPLSGPRKKIESRRDYKERLEKLEDYKEKLYEKYYHKIIRESEN